MSSSPSIQLPPAALDSPPAAVVPNKPAGEAANEEFTRAARLHASLLRTAGGWNPYEVWYQRVRLEQKRLGLVPADPDLVK